MTGPTPEALRDALRAIKDPASGQDLVAAGLLEGIEVRGGLVQASLLTDRAHAQAMEPVRRDAEAALGRVAGVTNATVVLTAHKGPAPVGARSGQRDLGGATPNTPNGGSATGAPRMGVPG